MGADLIIQFVVFKGKLSEEERQKRLIARIKKATKEELEYYFNEDGYYSEGEIEDMKLSEKRNKHIEIVNNFFNSLGYRDVSSIQHKGETLMVTGGMSYGDNPTDSYDCFYKISLFNPEILKAGEIE